MHPPAPSPAVVPAGSETLPYHRLHRAGPWSWWRPFVGTLLLVVSLLLVTPFVVLGLFVLGLLAAGESVGPAVERMTDLSRLTPLGLAYLNVAIAAMIPVTWLLVRTLHGLRPRWLSSVRPGLRWRWMLTCLGLAFAALFLTVVVAALLPAQAGSAAGEGELNDFTRTTRDFLLLILLLTPLQAAGEEYVFRGYLTQAFGGLVRSPWLAVVGPAFLFALAHGAQDPPVFFDRLAFGLVAGVLVVMTGGLEAGIAMHVLNNFLAYGAALAYGDMAGVLQPSGGSWWTILVTLTQSLSYLGFTLLVARRQGVQVRALPRLPAYPSATPGRIGGP